MKALVVGCQLSVADGQLTSTVLARLEHNPDKPEIPKHK
jgi:hypothetical protein